MYHFYRNLCLNPELKNCHYFIHEFALTSVLTFVVTVSSFIQSMGDDCTYLESHTRRHNFLF